MKLLVFDWLDIWRFYIPDIHWFGLAVTSK